MTIGWSSDFIVVTGERPAAEELQRVQRSGADWVLVDRGGGSWRYVFSRIEVLEHPRLAVLVEQGRSLAELTLTEALDLHEGMMSRLAEPGAEPALLPTPWPTAARYVQLRGGQVVAVGGADVERLRRTRSTRSSRPAAGPAGLSSPTPATRAVPPPSGNGSAADDEGVSPLRYPSIGAEGALQPGAAITIVVDLLREEDDRTFGAVALPAQPDDWQALELEVLVQSPAVVFDDGGRGRLTVRRNDASLAARISGQLSAALTGGEEIEVKARFMLGTRFCGSAARRITLGAGASASVHPPSGATVQVDAAAVAPDLTVFITMFEKDAPGKLHWRMVTVPFRGLPPRLDEQIDLGQAPGVEASQLFKQFAKLERGRHREAIEGFGEELWRRAPAAFQSVYWALCDHLRRSLAIQFVSDDPHLPWELMSPYRDGEAHGPIALRHAVARWIGHWQGYMPNRLPNGRLVAIAPHYRSVSTQLSLAEAAVQKLVKDFGAEPLPGTREAVLKLLEQPPAEPVALLYFSGHGAFAADAAGASLIKLEDGAELSAVEVARQRVQLGERHGTVVVLNACEVGATGSVLGNVGGWADAFLSRRFGAFIAPLWAIDEEDGSEVTQELMQHIVAEHVPLGEALRDLRQRHGDTSPTFYSYLLYGDVTARLGGAG
jgi:hypothetical protein